MQIIAWAIVRCKLPDGGFHVTAEFLRQCPHCLLAAMPVQAARNTKKYCFPLDTTAWRISDAYGARA